MLQPQPKPSSAPYKFDHENLKVYQHTITFVAWVSPVLESLSRAGDVKDQLDAARGSGLECAAALDVLVAKGKLTPAQVEPGKELLCSIVSMLVALLRSIGDRTYKRGTNRVVDEEAMTRAKQ
jgi:hypothetical protein